MREGWLTRPAPPREELRGLGIALIALPVAALPHAWYQPAWVTLLMALAVLLRGWVHWRGTRAPSLWVMSLLALGAGAMTLAHYGTLFGQEAGSALLLVMIALKLLEARSRRDVVIALFLGYFVIVTTYFFDQAFWIGLWSLLGALLLTAALVQLHAARPLTPGYLARRAGTMLVHALPFMLILFIVFPRIEGPLWGDREDRDDTAQTGLSDQMNPGDIAELLQDETVAARVEFHGEIPPTRAQYWRSMVMTDFDGRQWRADRGDSSIERPAVEGDTVDYTVTLEPTRSRYLPVLEYPARLPDDAELRANHQVIRDQRITGRIQYTASADLTRPPGSDADTPALDPETRERALALPPSAAPQARAQAGLWTATHDDPRAIIETALARFSGEPYRYTLQPPQTTGDHTDAFLFDTHAGYCEHYASAFAVLMRAAGIPARVVTGYHGGEWRERGGYLRLRNADAHAWNEVWIDGEGWRRVDPTAAIAPERIEQGLQGLSPSEGEQTPDFLRREGLSWLQQARFELQDWREFIGFRWETWVLAFTPERQQRLFERFGLDPRDWRSVLIALGVSFGTLAAGVALWLLLRGRERRDPAQRALYRLSRRLRGAGLAHQPHESVDAWVRRVAAARPQDREALEAFARHYNALRFAPLDRQGRHEQRQALKATLARIPRRRPATDTDSDAQTPADTRL
ncbi:DUF3488 and transglutaminase-like domain-containing protein [Thioalkalivibrio sp. ALR17-21]|uniref:DUF3488 and transglutaminase-like domain-containing protein n=1 Tax=Thioalkalivibrio sp. ALR17-21 TaxID=1269813 RepID=UPI0004033A38|nr:DUF3488 and transglutaminase-like domain-containing protein [Thioalkalivibrio sp. ALR17-21]